MDKIKKFLKSLLFSGIKKDEYKSIQGDILEENKKSLRAFSFLTSFFLLILFIVSFTSDTIAVNRWTYLSFFILISISFVVSVFNKNNKILLINTYSFIALLFILGILLGTINEKNEYAVTFIVLLFIIPLLFTDKTYRMILCIYLGAIIFIIVAIYTKNERILASDIINVVVFSVLSGFVCTYVTDLKLQRFLYLHKLSVLSETDSLTGVKNRNSYEKTQKEYALKSDQIIACVYIDVNGLHETNNMYGHNIGDKMLQFVVATMEKEFGKNSTFRIGGDEFVALIPNINEEDVKTKVNSFRKTIEDESYHASIGYSYGNTSKIDIISLVAKAEKRMYVEKRLFYRSLGTERRIRD